MSDVSTSTSPLIEDEEEDDAYAAEMDQEAEDNVIDIEEESLGTFGESPITEDPGTVDEDLGSFGDSPGSE